jgi:hypothetical protein
MAGCFHEDAVLRRYFSAGTVASSEATAARLTAYCIYKDQPLARLVLQFIQDTGRRRVAIAFHLRMMPWSLGMAAR